MPNGFSFSTTSALALIKDGYYVAIFPFIIKEKRTNTEYLESKWIMSGSFLKVQHMCQTASISIGNIGKAL